MAAIHDFIAEYREAFEEKAIDFNSGKPPRIVMKRFVRLLGSLDDVRVPGRVTYPLTEIVALGFLAVLGNASEWQEIPLFADAHRKWLQSFLALEHGIPSHDTFRRVFSLIRPEQLQAVTVAFLSDNIAVLKRALGIGSKGKRQLCVDGKENRSTGRKHDTTEEIRNLQTLHIYDTSHGICLFSEAIDAKTNEIPVAQRILACMELRDTVVTFDALNTQKRTLEIIVERKGDYVGALKGNHPVLEEEVGDFFTPEERERIRRKDKDYYRTVEKAHNKVETREFFLTRSVAWFRERDEWAGLRSFLCYRKHSVDLINGKETDEARYYLSSETDVLLCAEAIRGHWGIENRLHWHLDTAFLEDDNATVDRNAFSNLSLMNKMSLSLLKLAKPVFDKHSSIRSLRKIFGWNLEDSLTTVLSLFDEDAVLAAVARASLKPQGK